MLAQFEILRVYLNSLEFLKVFHIGHKLFGMNVNSKDLKEFKHFRVKHLLSDVLKQNQNNIIFLH